MTTKCNVSSWISSWTRKNCFFFCSKGHKWDNWWNLNKAFGLGNDAVINVNFQIWSLYCDYIRDLLWF